MIGPEPFGARLCCDRLAICDALVAVGDVDVFLWLLAASVCVPTSLGGAPHVARNAITLAVLGVVCAALRCEAAARRWSSGGRSGRLVGAVTDALRHMEDVNEGEVAKQLVELLGAMVDSFTHVDDAQAIRKRMMR